MKKTVTSIFALILAFTGIGQQDLTIYHMPSIQQMSYVNLAQMPKAGMNIGLPGISSMYFRQNNTFLNPENLFQKDGDFLVFQTEDYLKSLESRNALGFESSIDLLSFGMKIGQQYIGLSIREKFSSNITLPRDFLALPFTGNASFDELDNGIIDLSDFDINMVHYREYGLNFVRDLNENWSIGGRVKYLYGMENINVSENSIQWQTDEETWDQTVSGQLTVNTSGFWPIVDSSTYFDLEEGEVSEYLLQRKNNGFGIDLGAKRRIGDKLEVSANIVDLGFITWKSYNKNLISNNGSFFYDGLQISDNMIYNDSLFTDSLEILADELWQDFKDEFEVSDNEESYRTYLSSRVYLGASYLLYEGEKSTGTVGALLQTQFYKGSIYPTFTLSYNQTLQRWLSASLSYSIMDNDYKNIGFGLSANAGPVQLYILADNLMAANRTQIQFGSDEDARIQYPSYSKNIHLHAGININLNRDKKDRDKDGVPDKADKCPKVFGQAKFDGCPDSDGDGVEDAKDDCPTVSGEKKFNGCPDSDKDGIPDMDDDCPTERGTKETKGCPDSDKDGIVDEEDQCPNEKGLLQFNGCPDSDNDGIPDEQDECPLKKGSLEFGGCPDTDGDGVSDKEDSCPKVKGPKDNFGCPYGDRDQDGIIDAEDDCPGVKGPIENNGCPYDDLDNDGVFDKDDRCPKTPGLPENEGCPKIEEEEQEILNTAFNDLEFVSGKDEIKEQSFESLDELAALLEKKEDWKIRISGHTDAQGTEESNLELSKNRANAVGDYLESRGVNRSRIFVRWFGETEPIASNETEEGRQQNRRVELEVVFE